jgi:hypothetical protein
MPLHWSYSADFSSGDAGYSEGSTVGIRDQVRFLVQDTKTTRQLVLDEEIDWVQTQEQNVYFMAAAICDSIVIRLGGMKQKRVGDLDITYDLNFYKGLAVSLRSRGSFHQVPYAGGISIADKLAQEANSDAVRPRTTITEFDNPGADQPGAQSSSSIPFPHV